MLEPIDLDRKQDNDVPQRVQLREQRDDGLSVLLRIELSRADAVQVTMHAHRATPGEADFIPPGTVAPTLSDAADEAMLRSLARSIDRLR